MFSTKQYEDEISTKHCFRKYCRYLLAIERHYPDVGTDRNARKPKIKYNLLKMSAHGCHRHPFQNSLTISDKNNISLTKETQNGRSSGDYFFHSFIKSDNSQQIFLLH